MPALSPAANRISHQPALVALIVGALFLAGAVPLIVGGYAHGGRAASDQYWFYGPTIVQFLRQWPHPNLADYPAATTPGYYLAIAAAAQWFGTKFITLQLLGSLFTLGLLVTLALAVGRRARLGVALALCLPVVCSPYVFPGGVWMLPDGAGWWGVLCVLLVALRPRVDGWTYVCGGLALLALVLVRQSHLWVAAPLCVAAWLGDGAKIGDGANARDPLRPAAERTWRLFGMLLAVVPALAALGWFAHLWHGLTPPNQQPLVAGGNRAAPAMALATAGMLGIFYAPLVWRRAVQLQWIRAGTLGAVCGAIIGAVPITTYDQAAGRFSGIWKAAAHAPYFLHRSPVIIALAALGGAVIALWLAVLPRRDRWMWAIGAIGFLAAQVTAHYAFQRYYEPMVLIAAAISLSRLPEPPRRCALIGPISLAVVLAVITAISIR